MSPESDGRPYKRKTVIIKKALQWKFILLVMAMVATAVALIAVDMFSALGRYVAENAADVNLAAIYADSRTAFAVKCVVYLAGVFVVTMAVSHRVAGPIFRFERSAEKVGEGDLTHRVFLRKGDELLDMKDGFNAMVAALRDKVADDMSHVHRAQNILKALAADATLPAALAVKAKEAAAEVEKVGRTFKI